VELSAPFLIIFVCQNLNTKMKKHQLISVLSLTLILFFTSCTMEKRLYMPGYYVEWMKSESNSKNTVLPTFDLTKQNKTAPDVRQENLLTIAADSEIKSNTDLIASTNNTFLAFSDQPVIHIKPNEKTIPVFNNMDIQVGGKEICDTIVLISGEKIVGKILEIKRNDYIKYKLCGNDEGNTLKLDMAQVSMIKYSIQFETEDIGKNAYKYGLLSAIIFSAGIILGPIAVIYGVLSLSKIKKYPERYKGRIKAIIGIILGSIGIICSILFFLFAFMSFGII
jgi:hypothetical protein